MTYDTWKTRSPDDEYPDPDEWPFVIYGPHGLCGCGYTEADANDDLDAQLTELDELDDNDQLRWEFETGGMR